MRRSASQRAAVRHARRSICQALGARGACRHGGLARRVGDGRRGRRGAATPWSRARGGSRLRRRAAATQQRRQHRRRTARGSRTRTARRAASTAASAQLARASNTSGSRRSSRRALTMRSASVRLHDADFAATKCCHSAAATPATREQQRDAAGDAAAGRRRARPGRARQTTPIATKIRRCSTHHGQGCMSNDVLRDQRGGDADERRDEREPARATQRSRGESRSRRRHSATWAISSISTQAPSGSCATPKALRACAPFSAEDLAEQLRAAVGHQVLLGEVGRAVDQAHARLTMRSTLSRSPTAACSVPSRSIATARAALLAGGGGHVAAELADPGLAVALGDVAGEEDQVAGAHEGHVGGGRASPAAAA